MNGYKCSPFWSFGGTTEKRGGKLRGSGQIFGLLGTIEKRGGKELVTVTVMRPSLNTSLLVTGNYRYLSLNNFSFHPDSIKNTSDSHFYESVTNVLY